MGDLLDDDIDFDRAASAFPDISLDGEGDIPAFATPPSHTPPPGGPFDLDAFGGPTPAREVRVTGHDEEDEIGKFESEFPELDIPQVRHAYCVHDRLEAHKTRRLTTTPTDSQPTVLSTHIWCPPPFRAAPTAIRTLSNSNLKPTNRRGGTRGHPVRPFFSGAHAYPLEAG